MKKDNKTLQDHFVVIHNLLVIGAIVMVAALIFINTVFFWFVAIPGFLMMIASILYAAKYYKCPHCGAQLDPRGKVPHFCPDCGNNLN